MNKEGWVALIAVLSAVGCSTGEKYEASLDDASGLSEGAGVYVAGVRVGKVDALRVEGDSAIVEMTIDSDHDVTLHADACVLAVPHRGAPAVMLEPGEDGSFGSARIPTCSTEGLLDGVGEAIQEAVDVSGAEAGEAAGRFIREATGGFREGIGDAREVGHDIGQTAGELGDGVRDGLEESQTGSGP